MNRQPPWLLPPYLMPPLLLLCCLGSCSGSAQALRRQREARGVRSDAGRLQAKKPRKECDNLSAKRSAAGCPSEGHERRPILITGLGGSGTHSVAELARVNGVALAHELVGEHGSVAWGYAVDARLTSDGFLYDNEFWRTINHAQQVFATHPRTLFENVIHLVRCPIHVMSAQTYWSKYPYDYVRKHANVTAEWHKDYMQNLRLYGETWLQWNRHIEGYAAARYRISAVRDLLTHLRGLLNMNTSEIAVPAVEAHLGHHTRNHSFTWEELRQADATLAKAVHEKAVEYGFGPDCLEDAPAGKVSLISLSNGRALRAGPLDAACTKGAFCEDRDGITWRWAALPRKLPERVGLGAG